MCTLAIAFQVLRDAPIAVAANRDELLNRPSRPPQRIDGEPAIVAPRDEEAGGTWIGYNEHGLFVAITNRWTDTELEGERSRGLLVRDALSQADVNAAATVVEEALKAHEYEGFYLAIADHETAVVLAWDGTLQVTSLDPGLHVVMNTGVDDRFEMPDSRVDAANRQLESARSVREVLQPAPDESVGKWLDRAGAVLGDHEVGVCIHGNGFGTRSASLIAIKGDGTAEYRFANGPPCETAFEAVNEQL